uniref:Laminin EGF-like domain-containing protein n=1 Tax=Bubo bubo TaxID=30461 RepID=A0A8C0E8Z3_BUBBB
MTASHAPALAARPAQKCPAAGRWSAPTAPQGREVRLVVGRRGGCGQHRHGQTLLTFSPSPGKRCELCDDGFFGDPLGKRGPVSPCVPCQCHGNVDLNAVGNCEPVSGRCLRCLYNTTGEHCERCQPGFYGDAGCRGNGDGDSTLIPKPVLAAVV